MGLQAQFLRLSNTTSAVFLWPLNLKLQQKILVIGGDLWNNEILSIAPNHRYFLWRSKNWLLWKHCWSSIAESQKLSLGANVKDSHAQNDRTAPFQSEIILIAFVACFEKCINSFGMCCANSWTSKTTPWRFVNLKFAQRLLANHICLRILDTCANFKFRILKCHRPGLIVQEKLSKNQEKAKLAGKQVTKSDYEYDNLHSSWLV